ncbi:MAG TPA: hypothetical protein VGG19_17000 [Tepidisphaeraceae bacterium]|jgi:hypothetical protein
MTTLATTALPDTVILTTDSPDNCLIDLCVLGLSGPTQRAYRADVRIT